MPSVQKIFHANVYVDGTTDLLGKWNEATLPDITAKTVEHMGGGMIGTVELPVGLEALTMTVKWGAFFADALKLSANPMKSHRLQVRANVETYGAGGREEQLPLVVSLTASWKKAGGRTFKPQENGETEDELTCTYIRVELDGQVLYELDLINNIWKVDGEDLLETMRKNLGGS